MDDVAKRRIAGALALVVIALAAATLLPRPESVPSDPSLQRVTIDLTAAPPSPPAARPDSTLSPTVAVMPGGNAPEIATAPPLPEPDENDASVPAEPEPEPPPAIKPEPVAKPPPVAAKPSPSPAATPAPVAPTPPALKLEPALRSPPVEVAKAAPVAPKPATAPAGWMIQIGSFADIANAHVAQDKLKSKGFASILSPAETAKGTLYRVRAGPFASKAAAAAAKPAIVALGFAQANLVEK